MPRELKPDAVAHKMFRAREHFEELVRVFEMFYAKHTEAVSRFKRVEDLIKFNATVTVPTKIPLIVGDCLQNMRSSLDYLVWDLVKVNGGTPNQNHMFPICKNSRNYQNAIDAERLLGIHPKAAALIDQMQPYHLPFESRSRQMLSVLDELTNINKHRHILGTLFENRHPTPIIDPMYFMDAKVSGTDEFGRVVTTSILTYIAFEDTSVKSIEIAGALDTLFRFLVEEVFSHFVEFFP